MKTIFYFLVTLIAGSSAFSQQSIVSGDFNNEKHLKSIQSKLNFETDENQYKGQYLKNFRKPAKIENAFYNGEMKKRLDSAVYENTELTGEFQKRHNRIFTYDDRGYPQSFEYLIYDNDLNSYVKLAKELYTYNNDGEMIEREYYWCDEGNNVYELQLKEEFTYNNSSNLELVRGYYWTDSAWIDKDSLIYFYNTNQTLDSIIYCSWRSIDEIWIHRERETYEYDTNNRITRSIFSLSISAEYSWVLDEKVEYTYDADSTIIIGYEFDENWNLNSKDILYQDDNGNAITKKTYTWHSMENYWIIQSKEDYTFDINNNLTQRIRNYWNSDSAFYFPAYKWEFIYDLTYDVSSLLLPPDNEYFGSFERGDMLIDMNYYTHYGSPDWEHFYKDSIYYSDQFVGIRDLNNRGLTVYPNPAKNKIKINTNEVSNNCYFNLFDLNGRVVLQKTITNSESIDVSSLNKGIYFYRIFTEDNIYSGKVIKE